MTLLEASKNLKETIIKHRRYLHQHAEVHDNLPITTAYVMAQLKAMGYDPKEISKSGIVALAGNKKPGKVFLLRADMDALPMLEEAEVPFKSQTPNMHACGHDFHTSMLLGAAQLLKDHEDEIEGTVKLMFQPAEETLSGAKAMIEAGVLENPKVDAAAMIHVASGVKMPAGALIIPGAGVSMASADWFEIKITGKGCHGAMPHNGVDPLNVLSHVHLALQEIIAREVPPGEKLALTIGQMHGGNTSNVIPSDAYMTGTLRTIDDDTRAFVKTRMTEISTAVATAFRASAEVVFTHGCPCMANDATLRKQIVEYNTALLGNHAVIDMDKLPKQEAGMGSEDFSYISEKVPSVMMALVANAASGELYPIHHPKVVFNEDALAIGSAVYANTAIQWLKNNS